MEVGQRGKFHYAWLILAGCCILQGASLGLVNNCAGVFFSPVCEELGFEMGELTFYRTLYALSSAAAMPVVAWLLLRADVRAVIGAAAVVYGASTAAMGLSSELWQWYAAGIFQGFSSSFLCTLPAPILLGNWFKKNTGTVIGIAAVFSGFMGMLGSAGFGFAIPAIGWRASYLLQGLLAAGLILPVAILILRYRPEDMGLHAYGEDPEEERKNQVQEQKAAAREKSQETHAGLSVLFRQPVFYMSILIYASSCAGAYLNSFLPGRGMEAGMTLSMAAMLTSLALFGNMFSKLFLGRLCDVCGVVLVFAAAAFAAAAGHLLLLSSLPAVIMTGACIYGITMPLSTVLLPLFGRIFWNGDAYGTAFSYVSMAGTLLASPFNMLFGQFYDMTGSYRMTIIVSGCLVLLTFLLVCAAGRGELRPRRQGR